MLEYLFANVPFTCTQNLNPHSIKLTQYLTQYSQKKIDRSVENKSINQVFPMFSMLTVVPIRISRSVRITLVGSLHRGNSSYNWQNASLITLIMRPEPHWYSSAWTTQFQNPCPNCTDIPVPEHLPKPCPNPTDIAVQTPPIFQCLSPTDIDVAKPQQYSSS